MKHARTTLILSILLTALPCAAADATVKLELVGEGQAAAMAFHRWARTLAEAGIDNVRFRSARDGDRVGIEQRQIAGRPMYVVTGVVRGENEILLPSGRVRRGDVGRMKQWLEQIARHGPGGPGGGAQGQAPFGLTAKQYASLRADLAQLVERSTKDRPRAEVVDELARQLDTTVRIDSQARKAMAEEIVQTVEAELQGVAAGTALAYLLRPAGLCLVPSAVGDRVLLAVVPTRPELAIWPIGRNPNEPTRKVLPALYTFRDVNVQNVPVDRVITAIAAQLEVPVLIDRNALVRHGIEPSKEVVALPRSRQTTYSLVLQKALFQAGLKLEVREDEAGQPLFWITSLKPM